MKEYGVAFAAYEIGEKAYEKIPETVGIYGKKLFIIGGETALSKAMVKLVPVLEKSALTVLDTVVYGKECTYEKMERLSARARELGADIIVGVGGGKALDTAKGTAEKLGLPVFTLPTIASTCAAASAMAIVYREDHSFDSFYFLRRPAVCTFIDTQIIAEAPAAYLRAGMGDTIAKHYECAFSVRGETLDHSNALAVQISGMCAEPVMQYGARALEDCCKNIPSFAVEQVVLAAIITTGMVSVLIEMKYNGALAHALFYGCTRLPGFEENNIHGDSVGYGVLVQLMMDQQEEEARRLRDFYKTVGIPTCLADEKLPPDRAYLAPALDAVPEDEDMEVIPYPVTPDMVFRAICAVEDLA